MVKFCCFSNKEYTDRCYYLYTPKIRIKIMFLIEEIENDCLYVNYLSNHVSQLRDEKSAKTALEMMGERKGIGKIS